MAKSQKAKPERQKPERQNRKGKNRQLKSLYFQQYEGPSNASFLKNCCPNRQKRETADLYRNFKTFYNLEFSRPNKPSKMNHPKTSN